ncbi:histidine phosphatase family protein [bacterium]|jgi:broad specificity phosphatase PhoE|nr:histidine phosphatase family protein [bacterium]
MNKKIWLIRHAESESNIGVATSDPASIKLTETGFKQAELLASNIPKAPDLIVTSSYIRTKQTAGPVIAKFSHIPSEEWDTHEFTYLSPAKCQNTTPKERFPMVKGYWDKSDNDYCDGPGAESFRDFFNRVHNTIKKTKERKEQTIALFSHKQFISGMLWVLQKGISELHKGSMSEFRAFIRANDVKNAGFVEIVV